MNEQALARAAAIGLPHKPKLPKHIYKNFHGSTYRVQIRNKYVGNFDTVEEAQQFLAELFAQKEKPTECEAQQA